MNRRPSAQRVRERFYELKDGILYRLERKYLLGKFIHIRIGALLDELYAEIRRIDADDEVH